MNKQRKREISNQVIAIQSVIDKLNTILNEEQNYFDNIPDNLQMSVRADESEESIDILTEQIDILSNVIDELGGIQ